jgi:hypothetical protein
MKIEAAWSKPIDLKLDASGALIYTMDWRNLPSDPGVYVFGRKHGETVTPIYIGETLSIRGRMKNHLESVPLMRAMENEPSGSRFVMYCTVKAGTQEKAKKHIRVLERALILHSQSEGHELVNKRGTKLPTDTISFKGNRTSEAIAPRTMLIKRALSRGTSG